MTYYGLDKINQKIGEEWLKALVYAQDEMADKALDICESLDGVFSFIGSRIDWDEKLGATEAVKDE